MIYGFNTVLYRVVRHYSISNIQCDFKTFSTKYYTPYVRLSYRKIKVVIEGELNIIF